MINILPGTEFKVSDNIGEVVWVEGIEFRPSIPTKFGIKPAFKCNVTTLTGDTAGTVYEDVLFFNAALVSRLQKSNGEPLLGELAMVQGKERSYVDLTGPTAQHHVLAESFNLS